MAKSDREAKLGFVLEAMPMCLRGDLVVDYVAIAPAANVSPRGASAATGSLHGRPTSLIQARTDRSGWGDRERRERLAHTASLVRARGRYPNRPRPRRLAEGVQQTSGKRGSGARPMFAAR
jgi:hypothetical protein